MYIKMACGLLQLTAMGRYFAEFGKNVNSAPDWFWQHVGEDHF
jgi:hypothetical protein